MNRKTKTKRHILSIIDYALKETSVEKVIKDDIKLKDNKLKIKNKIYDLKRYDNVYVLGSGKASYRMARSINSLLGKRIREGLVIYNKKERNIGKIKVLRGTHPLPSVQSLRATKKLISLAEKTTEKDLTIYLLSGGTSSLLCYPKIDMKSFIELNKKLLKSGKDIKQVNKVRKKYSNVKGGRLMGHFKGKIVNLVVSDVVGDSPEFIGSGPLYSKKKKVDNVLIANNTMVVKKAMEKARHLGYRTRIVFPNYEGSPKALARKFLRLSKKMKRSECIISGGELNSEVKGKGLGGPNQEFVLYCHNIKGTVASIDTDGTDGNSKAAGAIADETDFTGLGKKDLEKYLKNSDSYSFFRKRNCSLVTGPTGTNLNDLRIMIKL